MSQTDPRRTLYQSKVNSLGSEISSLNTQLGELEGRAVNIDSSLSRLPTRIDQLRKANYRALSYLEKDQASLSERWTAVGPGLKETVRSNVAALRPEVRALEGEINLRRMDPSYDMMRLTNIEVRLATLRLRASNLSDDFNKSLGDLGTKLQAMEQDVGLAEATLSLASQASFQWKVSESPVVAFRGKDMNADLEGVVTLTNQRFLYESEKEIVLKKKLFIATEKKKVRALVLDQPVGAIDSIAKGRVGLLAGHGLFINFKPQTGFREMKLDVKSHEADWIIRFYNYVTSGQADAEISAVGGAQAEEKPKPQMLVCPRCGAPYTDEVYRGQTTVNCRYCGTAIPVP